MSQALFYEGRWYMFSNFSAFTVYWCGREWMTSEHAYQASKFIDIKIIESIHEARSAHDAKEISRSNKVGVRSDWSSIKLEIMEGIIRAKLHDHLFIKEQLLSTGDLIMIEDSPTDSYWGRGPDGKGENHLGKIWMKLRGELRADA